MGLDTTTSELIAVAAAVTRGDEARIEAALGSARDAGVELPAIREMLLQVVLFAGFPRVINAFEKLAVLVPEPAVGEPAAVPSDYWAARGRERFGAIYGSQADRVLEAIAGFHPDLADWILRDAYGKVLSRPELTPVVRELASVAMLALLDLPRQLFSHARGACRVGASADQVRAALDVVAPDCRPDTLARARAELEKAVA